MRSIASRSVTPVVWSSVITTWCTSTFLDERYQPLAEHFISFDDLIAEHTSGTSQADS